MTCTIVEYSAEHTQLLRQIYLEARQQAFTWADPLAFALPDFDAATQGETILVALYQEVPVGFIAWWPPDNFIHSLYVAPGHGGKGVGKALLAECLARIGRPATLKCLQANTKAMGFYRAQGWATVEAGESADGPYLLLYWP
ncbi:GNAT family N-acetyltransferase [Hymenobacter lucidus]|uniref:GNAT family N-acetyltransferase n=1 Tax=Hymenobacter lucidus TaxID=2880930 RepID=A0ABS8AVQ8_9BACT|nr:GNAT family N-acetyltransferase [Hymenobacter lucidus]MCB2409644.1 GNAT family N-acetyltransferase [Hymenobacter lucidus]